MAKRMPREWGMKMPESGPRSLPSPSKRLWFSAWGAYLRGEGTSMGVGGGRCEGRWPSDATQGVTRPRGRGVGGGGRGGVCVWRGEGGEGGEAAAAAHEYSRTVKRPTAMRPHRPHAPCTAKASRGSSMRRRRIRHDAAW